MDQKTVVSGLGGLVIGAILGLILCPVLGIGRFQEATDDGNTASSSSMMTSSLSSSSSSSSFSSSSASERSSVTGNTPFTVVQSGQYGQETRRTVVVRNDAELAISAGILGSDVTANFDDEMIVAIYGGRKLTGGHMVAVDRIETDAEGDMTIYVTETAPGNECVVTQALTSPFVIVRTDRTEGAVDFEFTQKTVDCE